jgi:hypothetical protein
MTDRHLHPAVAAKLAASADHATPGVCRTCGAPVLTARAGRVAALDVVADPNPVDVATEQAVRAAGGLTWHLVTTGLGVQRITWRGAHDIRAGPPKCPVLADHTCPPQPVQERLL